MDLLCSRFAQKLYDTPAGRSSDNGIIDQNHIFPLNHTFYRRKLDFYLIQTFALPRRYKRPSNIFVFNQSYAIGNAGFFRKAQGSVQTAVRNSDHNIRVCRIGLRQQFPSPYPRFMDRYSVYHRIRSGKIDILKNTGFFLLFSAMLSSGFHTIRMKNQDFSRQYVSDKLCPHC